MQLNPYLTFNGQCEAAIKFYAKVLGGKIEAMMTYGGSPMADQTRLGMAQQEGLRRSPRPLRSDEGHHGDARHRRSG